MRFIFIVIFVLYGGIQAYFAAMAIHAFDLTTWQAALVAVWAVLMTVGPLLHWRLERCRRCHSVAVASAWLVFGWMGFSFLFFWCGLALDLIERITFPPGWFPRGPVWTFLLPGLVSLALWVWGFYSARHPRLVKVTVSSSKLPSGSAFRIVQISDLHLGLLINRKRLVGLLKRIIQLKPDALVSTGDLVDAEAHFLDGLSSLLADFHPPYGKFAVTGNHERYAGTAHALRFHEHAGFTMLRGKSVDVTDAITLAGVDDPAVADVPAIETALLDEIPAHRFVVLLKHQPRFGLRAGFDLQLSGHTHSGQIFPFGLLVKWVYPMIKGRHDLPDGRVLYVSSGTGTWGPPIRLLAPGEITLIELKGT
jgi:predicted MPP superfamily phosphohydrolase